MHYKLIFTINLLTCLCVTIKSYPMVFKLFCELGPSYLFNWLVELWLILSLLWSLKFYALLWTFGIVISSVLHVLLWSLYHLNTHLRVGLQYCFSTEGFSGSSPLLLKFLSVLLSPNTFTATLDWFLLVWSKHWLKATWFKKKKLFILSVMKSW